MAGAIDRDGFLRDMRGALGELSGLLERHPDMAQELAPLCVLIESATARLNGVRIDH
jgi:hypothetical protein